MQHVDLVRSLDPNASSPAGEVTDTRDTLNAMDTVAEEETPESIEASAKDENKVNGIWDPLQSASQANTITASNTLKSDLLEGIEEEGHVANSNTRLEDRVEALPTGSNRASQHRLDLKLTSPPLWELIEPPSDDGRKESTGFLARNHRLIPKSSYYHGPPTGDSAYGTAPIGHIGIHHPREILRIERDYSGGEVIQFSPSYPLELEGRLTPTQFLESINLINEVLISAHSLGHSLLDNTLAVFTLQLSRLVLTPHYEKEIKRLRAIFDDLNAALYNPVGLNLIWPANVAFLFVSVPFLKGIATVFTEHQLEIEYY